MAPKERQMSLSRIKMMNDGNINLTVELKKNSIIIRIMFIVTRFVIKMRGINLQRKRRHPLLIATIRPSAQRDNKIISGIAKRMLTSHCITYAPGFHSTTQRHIQSVTFRDFSPLSCHMRKVSRRKSLINIESG